MWRIIGSLLIAAAALAWGANSAYLFSPATAQSMDTRGTIIRAVVSKVDFSPESSDPAKGAKPDITNAWAFGLTAGLTTICFFWFAARYADMSTGARVLFPFGAVIIPPIAIILAGVVILMVLAGLIIFGLIVGWLLT